MNEHRRPDYWNQKSTGVLVKKIDMRKYSRLVGQLLDAYMSICHINEVQCCELFWGEEIRCQAYEEYNSELATKFARLELLELPSYVEAFEKYCIYKGIRIEPSIDYLKCLIADRLKYISNEMFVMVEQ